MLRALLILLAFIWPPARLPAVAFADDISATTQTAPTQASQNLPIETATTEPAKSVSVAGANETTAPADSIKKDNAASSNEPAHRAAEADAGGEEIGWWSFWIVLLLIELVFLIAIVQKNANRPGVVGVLVAIAPLFPAIATLCTLVFYLIPGLWKWDWAAPIVGVAVAAVLSSVTSFALKDFACAKYVIPSSFQELQQRFGTVESQLSGAPELPSPLQQPLTRAQTVVAEVKSQLDAAKADFDIPGVSWIEGHGYISAWVRLHRAEEALIEIQPADTVIAGALYDELRLIGSTIGQSDDLLSKIREAASVLDPEAATYLQLTNTKPAAALAIVTPPSLPDAVIGMPYICPLAVEGGKRPFTWTASGTTFPDWLKLSSAGTLTGTAPVAAANPNSFTLTVRVTDSANTTTTKDFVLKTTVFGIVTASPLPDGTTNLPYNQTLAVSGGSPQYQWTLTGQIPAGITLSPAGVLAGAPTAAGTSILNVMVKDGTVPNPLNASKTFSLTVKDAADTELYSGSAVLARSILRKVRQAINEFRDDRWNALVVARDHLTKAMIYTGSTSYVLFAIAIFVGAPRNSIIAAAAFFLVGAVTGLINRLNDEATADTAVEDYGLSNARLVCTPLISGLAGIAGVVLVALLPTATQMLSPGTSHGADKLMPWLSQIFDLHSNSAGIVVAAVFGLTPGLLFSKLREQSENYKNELKKSEASDGPAKTGGAGK